MARGAPEGEKRVRAPEPQGSEQATAREFEADLSDDAEQALLAARLKRARGAPSFVILDRPSPEARAESDAGSESASGAQRRRDRRASVARSTWSGSRRRRERLRFGEHAMRLGIARRSDVEQALEAQARHRGLVRTSELKIGEVLWIQGQLSRRNHERVLKAAVPAQAACGERALTLERLGAILVAEGELSPKRLRQALNARLRRERRTGRRPLLGAFLVEQGLVSERALARAEALLKRRSAFDVLERTLRRARVVFPVEVFLREALESSGMEASTFSSAVRARAEALEYLGRRLCLGEVLVVRGDLDPDVYAALIDRCLAGRVAKRRPLPHLVIEMIEERLVTAEQALWTTDVLEANGAPPPSPARLIEALVDAGFVSARRAAPYLRRALVARRTRRGGGIALVIALLVFVGVLFWNRRPRADATAPSTASEYERLRAETAANLALERMVEAIQEGVAGEPSAPAPLVGTTPQGAHWRVVAIPVEADTWRLVAFGTAGRAKLVREAIARARRTPARREMVDMAPSHTDMTLELEPLERR